MLTVPESRYPVQPPARRCGLPVCWCTPPVPAPNDYGTRQADPNERMVPRADLEALVLRSLPPGIPNINRASDIPGKF